MQTNQTEVHIPEIHGIKYATTEDEGILITKIQFEVIGVHPAMIAQIQFMQTQRASINVTFGTKQADRQLRFEDVDIRNGTIKPIITNVARELMQEMPELETVTVTRETVGR